MPRDFPADLALGIDRDSVTPLAVQIYDEMRTLILSGRLRAGSRLPGTRRLAHALGISRTTTLTAYDQLTAEGYIEARGGSGAFVAAVPPEAWTRHPGHDGHRSQPLTETKQAPPAAPLTGQPFDPGAADLAAFPFAAWSRTLARAWRAPEPALPHGRSVGGHPGLRTAIANHLRAMRGLDAEPEHVFVTAGLAETLTIVARALCVPGDAAWIEDPGYTVAATMLSREGLDVVPVPVDGEGLLIARGRERASNARLALVTPSRQFPLGCTMSLVRRLELVEWAREKDAWLIEDDYDGEYRYAGRPIPALASLDREGRTVYVGSFSKVMFRALRLGYLIAPAPLHARIAAIQEAVGGLASLVPQAALADFMTGGRFAQHVRRMRRLYQERRQTLLQLFDGDRDGPLAGLLEPLPSDAGLHATALLSDDLARRMTDTEAVERARAAGIATQPLSTHYTGSDACHGLLLGFACAPPDTLIEAGHRLATALA